MLHLVPLQDSLVRAREGSDGLTHTDSHNHTEQKARTRGTNQPEKKCMGACEEGDKRGRREQALSAYVCLTPQERSSGIERRMW